SSTAPDAAYIISDSGSMLVFAENAEQVAKLVDQRAQIPGVSKVVVFDGEGGEDGWVITLDELASLGSRLHGEKPELFDALVGSVEPAHLATLIYASGST